MNACRVGRLASVGWGLCLLVPAVVTPSPSSWHPAGQDHAQHRHANPRPETFEAADRVIWQKPDEVVAKLALAPGMVVADIGAGSGLFTRRFAEAVGPTGRAIGLDIDPVMIDYMKADARKLGLANYEARLVEPDDAGLPPASVDLIFLCNTFHHIADKAGYFARLRAALKPGGRLAIVDFGFGGEPAARNLKPDETKALIESVGYRWAESFLFLPRQYFIVFTAGEGS